MSFDSREAREMAVLEYKSIVNCVKGSSGFGHSAAQSNGNRLEVLRNRSRMMNGIVTYNSTTNVCAGKAPLVFGIISVCCRWRVVSFTGIQPVFKQRRP